MQQWKLQEVESDLPDLVKRCQVDGPQALGAQAVVVSRADYDRFVQPQQHSSDIFNDNAPLRELEVKFSSRRWRPLWSGKIEDGEF